MRVNRQQSLNSKADTAAISHLLICLSLSCPSHFSLSFKILFIYLLLLLSHLILLPLSLLIPRFLPPTQ